MGRKDCKTVGGVFLGPARFVEDPHGLLKPVETNLSELWLGL